MDDSGDYRRARGGHEGGKSPHQESEFVMGSPCSAFGDQSQQDISKGENHYRWKKLKELSKHHIH
tara:strand:- start:1439 stop:1633 length:195 start_codon:yes stop_codon:yes gene_type:complete